jgi:hypothetical protein
MHQATIDFDPGSHGHFLEYICNKYIFNVSVSNSPFFKNGSVHAINLDTEYQNNKQITSGHYTSLNRVLKENKVVYIKHNPKFDLILLNNIFHRCYSNNNDYVDGNRIDFDTDFILKWNSDIILKDNSTQNSSILKENVYAKLIERTHFQPSNVSHPGKEVFNFNFGSFFNLTDFLLELQQLSQFLNHVLTISPDLIKDWHMFIKKNQGYQTYQRVNYLIEKIMSNQYEPIEDNFLIHAGINMYLTQIARLYDTELHELVTYPTDTQQVYKILLKHFIEYDKEH